MANEYNPIAQAFRGFAIGVADGAAASNHPAGRMFGTAMQGAMAPVYQAQQLDLERAQATANEEDYFGMDPASEFEMVVPHGKELFQQVQAQSHSGGRDHFGRNQPQITESNISLGPKKSSGDVPVSQGTNKTELIEDFKGVFDQYKMKR